jgi:hypothetical protein
LSYWFRRMFSAFKSITSNTAGVDGIFVKFFKLLLPLICCHVLHVFNHAMTFFCFSSFVECGYYPPGC